MSTLWQRRQFRSAVPLASYLRLAGCVLLVIASGCLSPGAKAFAAGADVYVAHDEHGSPRYANYPLDKNYVLLSKDPHSSPPRPIQAAAGTHANEAQLSLIIDHYAGKYQVSPALVSAIISIESGYNSSAVSPKGARGFMQLMPATAISYGAKDPHDAEQNIAAGVQYLKTLITRYKGNVALALAAYNAGEGAVRRHGASIPPYRETMLYVPAVMVKAQGKD